MSLVIPTVTGYSAFWQAVSNINGEVGVPYAMRFARSSQERRASIALSRSGFRAYRAAMKALTGAAAGGTATDTYAQVDAAGQGPTANPGGTRTVSTVTSINRATTAADETKIELQVIDGLFAQQPSSYPVDASGNGGGGKRGV